MKEIDMRTAIATNIEKMQYHYNGLVEAYEGLPTLRLHRKQTIEDAILVIGVIMDGVMKEIVNEGGRI